MSAFLLVHNRKGNKLKEKYLSAMVEKLNHRGPDGNDSVLIDNTFISHHHLWITPEGYGEKQPIQKGSYYISFDGRLDNRDELYDLLDFNIKDLRNISDAKLCILLYDKYKEKSFDKIIGSYSYVIADLENNDVFGIRDPMGDRGFFYHVSKNLFIAASEEVSILLHPEVNCNIDDKTVSQFFAMEPAWDGSTFFSEIKELLPGNYLKVDKKNFYIKIFWEFKPKKILYKTDTEYAEHYKYLLEHSVKSRLRTQTPVSVMLSGGIDSNSVAALAAINNPHKEKVRAISWIFDELKECDERTYINLTCDMHRLKRIQFNADELWPLSNFSNYFSNPNIPLENLYRDLMVKVYEICEQQNSRVMFNGWHADMFYTGTEYWVLDLVKNFKMKLSLSSLLYLINNSGIANIHKEPAFRKLFSPFKFLKYNQNYVDSYNWLSNYAKSCICDQSETLKKYSNYINPKRARNLNMNISIFSSSPENYHLSKYSIEFASPYRDINLINFIINIPSYQMFYQGIKKYIAKNAMKETLPPEILNRNDKTPLTPFYKLGLELKELSKVKDIIYSNHEWRKYVKKEWIDTQFNSKMLEGHNEAVIWHCICFVSWLKNLHYTNMI